MTKQKTSIEFYHDNPYEDFSEDFWTTLGRFLGKYSNVFYAIRLPRSLHEVFGSLLPKVVQRDDVK